MKRRLTSIEVHRDFLAGTIVETHAIEDSACGIYPCYYRRLHDRLRVAASASALIADLGTLEINPSFRPREYLLGNDARQRFVRGTAALPKVLKNYAKRMLPDGLLRSLSRDRFWYESWDTIDARVHKLKPFERVTLNGAADTFRPDFSMRNPDELVEGVAAHLTRFVADTEERYPDHHHVMMIGGRDSQILALIPKRRPKQWHVFSAAPNRSLVRQWLGWNNVEAGRLFDNDNQNVETRDETERKIVCSDLYSDPRHMRWLPALRRIADEFGFRCFFWSGSAGDALHVGQSFHRRYTRGNPLGFFDIHLKRVPCLVGNYHQVVKNFTGCPLLCPYQTEDIWREVYRRHGPGVIPVGLDLRPRIGERLAGRSIRWAARNPAPAPYRYAERFDALGLYLRHLGDLLKKALP